MSEAKPTHAEIFALLQSINDRLGHETEDGKSGSGLTGRIMRVEARVHFYDRLKEQATGALAALTVAVAIIWWLTKAKLAAVFGVSGS